MKISHELPLSLLKYGYEWSDFDYCLPNFLEYKEYKEYFLQAKKDNRFIILDNGLFEGVHYTNRELLNFIDLIQPNIFVVPDEWNDSAATLRNAKWWMGMYSNFIDSQNNTKIMAVCQGKDLHELILCYQTLVDLGYKYIAINHSSEAYLKMFPNLISLKAQMYGRMEFIRTLVVENIIHKDIYHHLLGASDWKEFQVYGDWDFIKSCDTSSPIINGALGIEFKYSEEYNKPKQKMEDIFERDLERQKEYIIFNVNKFRNSIK